MRASKPVSISALLLVLCLTGIPIGSCSSQPPSERDQSLDRLRERLDDNQPAVEPGEEAPATETSEEEVTPQTSLPEQSMLLPFQYFGALPDDDPRVLGVFRLRTHRDPIVDGDTVAVIGLDASLRLVGLDAEEVFHGNEDLRMRAYSDFDSYLQTIYAESEGIPKFSTPMGETAREFARQFFLGDSEVRLEYDDLDRTIGFYGRYLVYVFTLREGQWVNYNLEAVRAGMSPYFMKYGYSRRFHREFEEAEAQAREEQRGIWDPALRHYPDYPQRREWWDRRARAIGHFELLYADDPTYIDVGNNSDWERLSDLEGQTITIFGTISDIHYDWNPPRILISHQLTDNFTLVGFRDGVFEPYNFQRYLGEYFYIRGELNFYQGRPQFIVDEGLEVWIEP